MGKNKQKLTIINFYLSLQCRLEPVSSWYWDWNASLIILTIWDKWQRCSSSLSIQFECNLSSVIFFWRASFLSGREFRFTQPNNIQRWGRIYQFTILSELFLNIEILIVFKKLIDNSISDRFIFPSSSNYLEKSSNTTWYWGDIYPEVKFWIFATEEQCSPEKPKISQVASDNFIGYFLSTLKFFIE